MNPTSVHRLSSWYILITYNIFDICMWYVRQLLHVVRSAKINRCDCVCTNLAHPTVVPLHCPHLPVAVGIPWQRHWMCKPQDKFSRLFRHLQCEILSWIIFGMFSNWSKVQCSWRSCQEENGNATTDNTRNIKKSHKRKHSRAAYRDKLSEASNYSSAASHQRCVT